MRKVASSALLASVLLVACSNSNSNESLPDGRVQIDAQINADAAPPPKTLVRIDPESPGANCPAGGSAVHVGQDLNGDGILEDSEIQSTSYICTPPNPSTIEGSISINNSVDAATLIGVTTITGNLVISAPGLDSIDLSSIQTLGGSFTVTGFSGTQISAGFVTVGGDIDVENIPTVTAVTFPQLTTMTGSFIFDGDATLTTLTAPLLTSVGDNFYIGDSSGGGAGAGFAFRAIGGHGGSPLSPANTRLAEQNVGNSALVTLSFPQLVTVGSQLSITSNSSLTTVSLPSLTSVSESLDANILSQFQSGFDPEHVPGILNNNALASLDLSALTTVGNTIKIQNTLLTSLDLSSLTSVGGTLDIGVNTFITSIDVSSLTTVSAINCGENCSVGGGIFIHDEAALSSIAFPSLVTVDLTSESLQLYNDDALTTFSAPVLTTLGAIQANSLPLLTPLDLSSVVTVGYVSIDSDPVLTSIDLSHATSIGDLDIESNPVLTSIDLSSVTSIDNDLTVESNTILTALSAPALTSVGTSIIINNSPALTTFDVPDLATQRHIVAAANLARREAALAASLAEKSLSLTTLALADAAKRASERRPLERSKP